MWKKKSNTAIFVDLLDRFSRTSLCFVPHRRFRCPKLVLVVIVGKRLANYTFYDTIYEQPSVGTWKTNSGRAKPFRCWWKATRLSFRWSPSSVSEWSPCEASTPPVLLLADYFSPLKPSDFVPLLLSDLRAFHVIIEIYLWSSRRGPLDHLVDLFGLGKRDFWQIRERNCILYWNDNAYRST